MIKGLLKGIAEAYIKEAQMRVDGKDEHAINSTIREIINKHSGLRVGSKVHYVPSQQERDINSYGNMYSPREHIGIITKMTIVVAIIDLSISDIPANVTSKIGIGVLQLGIFVPEDNMGYVINLDEFNTYKDNIDFVPEGECNG
nr:MAG: hypothetical protein [Bacteriophage sp.]